MAHEISDPQSVVFNNPFRERSMILKESDSFLDAVIKPVHEIVAAVMVWNLVWDTRFFMSLNMWRLLFSYIEQNLVGCGTKTYGFQGTSCV